MKRLLFLGALGTAGLSSAAQFVCGIVGSPATAPEAPQAGPVQVHAPTVQDQGSGRGGNGLLKKEGAGVQVRGGSGSTTGGRPAATVTTSATRHQGQGSGGSNGGSGGSTCSSGPAVVIDGSGNHVGSGPSTGAAADGSVALGRCQGLTVDASGSGEAGS